MPWISKALKLDPRPRRRNLQSVRWAISFLRPPGCVERGMSCVGVCFYDPPNLGGLGGWFCFWFLMLKFLLFYEVWTVLCWGRPVVANGDDTWILPPQTLFTLKARHIWCPRSPNKRCLTLNTRSWRNKPHRNLIILASEIWPIGKDVHSNLLEHTVHMLEDFMTVQNCSCQLCQIITSNPKLCSRLSKTHVLVCLPNFHGSVSIPVHQTHRIEQDFES